MSNKMTKAIFFVATISYIDPNNGNHSVNTIQHTVPLENDNDDIRPHIVWNNMQRIISEDLKSLHPDNEISYAITFYDYRVTELNKDELEFTLKTSKV